MPALTMAAQCKTPGAMVHVYGAPPRWRKNPDEAAKMVVAHSDAESAIVMKMKRAKVWSFQTCVLQVLLHSCGQCTLRAAANLCRMLAVHCTGGALTSHALHADHDPRDACKIIETQSNVKSVATAGQRKDSR